MEIKTLIIISVVIIIIYSVIAYVIKIFPFKKEINNIIINTNNYTDNDNSLKINKDNNKTQNNKSENESINLFKSYFNDSLLESFTSIKRNRKKSVRFRNIEGFTNFGNFGYIESFTNENATVSESNQNSNSQIEESASTTTNINKADVSGGMTADNKPIESNAPTSQLFVTKPKYTYKYNNISDSQEIKNLDSLKQKILSKGEIFNWDVEQYFGFPVGNLEKNNNGLAELDKNIKLQNNLFRNIYKILPPIIKNKLNCSIDEIINSMNQVQNEYIEHNIKCMTKEVIQYLHKTPEELSRLGFENNPEDIFISLAFFDLSYRVFNKINPGNLKDVLQINNDLVFTNSEPVKKYLNNLSNNSADKGIKISTLLDIFTLEYIKNNSEKKRNMYLDVLKDIPCECTKEQTLDKNFLS